jgi:hypothetical protein
VEAVTCAYSGKIRYADELDAQIALNRLVFYRETGSVERHEREAYYCSECGGWHLTSKLTRRSR